LRGVICENLRDLREKQLRTDTEITEETQRDTEVKVKVEVKVEVEVAPSFALRASLIVKNNRMTTE
jgi:hypothetical protein